MKIGWKQIGIAGALAMLVGVTVYAVDARVKDAEVQRFAQKFALLGTLRKSALSAYLTTIRGEITFWSVSDSIRDVHQRLQEGWRALPGDRARALQELYVNNNPHPFGERAMLADAGDGSSYSSAHRTVHDLAKEFVSGRGYYDFFLIDPDGNIIYTVEKEVDFATNLLDGPYRDTGLADVFRRAAGDDGVFFSDFGRYSPSNDAPAIFVARRMTDELDRPIGVMAMQLPTSRIVEIMQFEEGMGESGETYLVGLDLLMRSDSRFSEESTILSQRVDTATAKLALGGDKGISFTQDYRGVPVLSAYDSIDVDGYRWAVMAEIDEEEVRRSTAGIGMLFSLIGALFYALALWTGTVLGGFSWRDSSVIGDLPDLDVGQG